MRPQLKGVVWERLDDASVRLVYDVREQLIVDDPDGTVEQMLHLLRVGGKTIDELARALAIPAQDVADAISGLDEHLVLEDGDQLGSLSTDEAERYFSNLSFFESFASLDRSREQFHHQLRRSHVLVLGTGGLNSTTLPHLCGLGVGRLTLLDRDLVEPRNFARQYLYRWSDIGQRKVDRAAAWVRAFDPATEVEAIHAGVAGVDDITALLERIAPTVVMSGIDSPHEIDDWVNAACVAASVPYIRGGMWVTQGVVWSVDPGRSACRACATAQTLALMRTDPTAAAERAGADLFATKARANRGIGPVAGLIGSYAAFEVLRYLTGIEPPAYAGRPLTIDFAAGCATQQTTWPRDPHCVVCEPAAQSPSADSAEAALLGSERR